MIISLLGKMLSDYYCIDEIPSEIECGNSIGEKVIQLAHTNISIPSQLPAAVRHPQCVFRSPLKYALMFELELKRIMMKKKSMLLCFKLAVMNEIQDVSAPTNLIHLPLIVFIST